METLLALAYEILRSIFFCAIGIYILRVFGERNQEILIKILTATVVLVIISSTFASCQRKADEKKEKIKTELYDRAPDPVKKGIDYLIEDERKRQKEMQKKSWLNKAWDVLIN